MIIKYLIKEIIIKLYNIQINFKLFKEFVNKKTNFQHLIIIIVNKYNLKFNLLNYLLKI